MLKYLDECLTPIVNVSSIMILLLMIIIVCGPSKCTGLYGAQLYGNKYYPEYTRKL